MIKIEQLTKDFSRNEKTFSAVENVNLSIEKGKFVALIGHSGSGKTTLLNMIGGLIQPTTGKIMIRDTDITTLSKDAHGDFRNKHIGYVLQGHSLLGNFRILDNVCMPAYLSPTATHFRERALGLLEEVGLGAFAEDYPQNLSGGEMRRVAIVRAMMNNPAIILADEPTSNLDPENAHKVMEMLKKISKSGTTVLLTTHEFEYLSYVDEVYEMSKGKLQKKDSF